MRALFSASPRAMIPAAFSAAHHERHREVVDRRHGGCHIARADDRHLHALRRQPAAQAFAISAHARFAGAVGRAAGQAAQSRQRTHDGDLAALARDHGGKQRRNRVDHAVDIGGENLAHLLAVFAVNARCLPNARIGDDQVDGR